jgi:hypothetical protein
VLDTSATGLLHTTTGDDGAYLLEPDTGLGNYSEIRELTSHIFERSTMSQEQARIEIQNGTKNSTIAKTIASDLTNVGLTVMGESVTKERNSKTTAIYDLTLGQKPATIEYLRTTLHAQVFQQLPAVLQTNQALPQNTTSNSAYPTGSTLINQQQPNPQESTSDIVIVLGADQLLAKPETTNTNLNTNTSGSVNSNVNLNINSNSATTNKNTNTNVNINANINQNTNINSNINVNTNVNRNINVNSTNRNTNTNAVVNTNSH